MDVKELVRNVIIQSGVVGDHETLCEPLLNRNCQKTPVYKLGAWELLIITEWITSYLSEINSTLFFPHLAPKISEATHRFRTTHSNVHENLMIKFQSSDGNFMTKQL